MRRLAATGVILIAALAAVVAGQPEPGAAVVAIRNATILTVSRGTIPGGTILLRDGKIAAVGANVPIPAGADIIDATGRFVSPGLVDCHSHIAADSINEAGTTVSSMTGIEDVFDPTDVDIYRDLAGGLTDLGRLSGMLGRVTGRVRHVRLSQVSPLAVPVLLDIGRETVRTAGGEDALLAETEALVAEATGEAEPSAAPMRVHPVHRANLAILQRKPRAAGRLG